MLFSICIPTYNRASTILRTLESLEAQTFQDFEIIVVDDGSKDDTRNLIKSVACDKIIYIYKENGGKHTALNAGLECAKGELFLVLDSDDMLTPNCLEQMAHIWEKAASNPRCCGIMGRCMTLGGTFTGRRFGDLKELSYVQFHFGKYGGCFKDCCECLRTDIIGKYRWPEPSNTRFVPEAYVLDQIGLDYTLYCTDEIFKVVEYLDTGITKSGAQFIQRNYVGYLYNLVSKIDVILPQSKEVTFKGKVSIWWKYWNLVRFDSEEKGPRASKVSLIGNIVKWNLKIINHIKRNSYV